MLKSKFLHTLAIERRNFTPFMITTSVIMPTFTPNLKYDNIMEYRLSSHSGDLFFDLKENNEEQYLKITQSKNIGSGNFRREKIFIDRSELLQFRDAINKAIEYWSLETKKENKPEKKYSLEEKRQEYGNAYLPWEKEADEYLIRLYEEGKSIKELTEIFERNNGAIRSRLKKLGKL